MKLKRARVTNFKSVLDSDWFTLGELTCLVGKNESGKTAILEALEKLSSVRPEREALKDTDYPRMNASEYEESDSVDTAVETEWELDEEEQATLIRVLGDTSLLVGSTVSLSKDYDNARHWDSHWSTRDVAQWAIEHSGLSETDKAPLRNVSTTGDLLKALVGLPSPTPKQTAFLAELHDRWGTTNARVAIESYLGTRLPKFVYYSQFDRLPGRVSMEQLAAHQASGSIDGLPGARVFIALLSMVGSRPEDIGEIQTSEALIGKLEGVQTRMSQKIFEYWSQNKHLQVQFRFDQASPGDDAPFNSGKIFSTRIFNLRHQASIQLDERSTGFIWFFSFLVWFSEVQKQFGKNLIVLLDEPGLTLHARAQADLLRYIKTELIPKYQVVYTTHSPFMIDSADLLSCRTVEDMSGPEDQVLGTKVGDQILSTDGDTLFPLQAALGYDLTQTLFVGEHTLLVEGSSDLLYLQWADSELRKRGRNGLDPRWTVSPVGGITKIPSFMSLFGGSRLHVAVLTDFGDGDKKKVRDLRESELLQDGHVFSAEMFVDGSPSEADVEDILGRKFYTALVAATYDLKPGETMPAKAPEGAPLRVTQEVETHFKTLPGSVEEYDHFRPSSYLVSHAEDFTDDIEDSTLEGFESLFKQLNALLP